MKPRNLYIFTEQASVSSGSSYFTSTSQNADAKRTDVVFGSSMTIPQITENVFSPDSIVGLTTWIDANDNTKITSSGGYVDYITNKGSVVCDFNSVEVTTRPELALASVNSLNTIYFDGVDDVMTSSVNASTLFNATLGFPPGENVSNFTMCFVGKIIRNSTVGTYPFELDTIFGHGSSAIQLTLGSSYSKIGRIWYGDGSSVENNWVKTEQLQSEVNDVSNITVTLEQVGGSYIYNLYSNGDFVSTMTKAYKASAYASPVKIGSEIFPASGGPANINLCEFMIYTGTLSAPELTQVNNYLNSKWGITQPEFEYENTNTYILSRSLDGVISTTFEKSNSMNTTRVSDIIVLSSRG